MYIGESANVLETTWAFLSGFELGCSYGADRGKQDVMPKDLIEHIYSELGMQATEVGLISRLLDREGDPNKALDALRKMVGEFYQCSMDPKDWINRE